MQAVTIKLVDGTNVLVIPGVGIAVPAMDNERRMIVGQSALIMPGATPMPVMSGLKSLEEQFNGPSPRVVT